MNMRSAQEWIPIATLIASALAAAGGGYLALSIESAKLTERLTYTNEKVTETKDALKEHIVDEREGRKQILQTVSELRACLKEHPCR